MTEVRWFACVCLFLIQTSHAQVAFRVGSTGADYGKDICTDERGNIYTTGYFQGTVDFDPSPLSDAMHTAAGDPANSGAVDIYLAKYDSTGRHVWSFTISSPGADMPHTIFTRNGLVYLTGYFGGNADFDPSSASFLLNSGPGRNAFIAVYDTSGRYLWAVNIGNPELGTISATDTRYEEGMDVYADASGTVYAVGVFDGMIDLDPSDGNDSEDTFNSYNFPADTSRDMYIAVYDPFGKYQHGFAIGGGGQDHGHGIRAGSDGSIYIAGFFSSTVDFDPGSGTNSLTSSGSFDIFLARYSSNAELAWVHRFGAAGADQVRPGALEIDERDRLYIAGDFTGTTDFEPGPGTTSLRSNGSGDVFFGLFGSDGKLVIVKGFGSAGLDAAHRVDIDATGNMVVAGWFVGPCDFDPGPGIAQRIPNASPGMYEIFLAKYDSLGTFLWANNYGGPVSTAGDFQMVAGLDVSDDGTILATGRFHLSADFDPSPSSEIHLTSAGDCDAFITKYVPDGSLWLPGTLAIGSRTQETRPTDSFTLYPHPVVDALWIESSGSMPIRITDLLGREVWSGHVEGEITIDLAALPAGIYCIRNDSVARIMIKR